MAMTKKERAQFDSAIKAARIAGALRWTSPVAPDVPTPTQFSTLSKGWLFGTYSQRVERACSSMTGHSFGNDDKTTTQGSKFLYSTELLALKAMRHEMESDFARKLAAVDERIQRLTDSANGDSNG